MSHNGRRSPKEDLSVILEAILFASDEPVPLDILAESLNLGQLEVLSAVAGLKNRYKGRGIDLERVAGGFMIVTRPQYAEIIERVLSRKVPVALSKGALETLAIIAYRQPVTRRDIQNVRGVNPESSIDTLLEKGLIKEAGRKKSLGRPKLYATTQEFLKKSSLNTLEDLPPVKAPQKRSPGDNSRGG